MTDDAPALPFLELVEQTLARQGKTKTWLSSRANVSRATLNNWRAAPRTPQASSVLAVADVLGIDHDKALRLAGLPTEEGAPPEEPASLSELEPPAIVERIHRLTGELERLTGELARRLTD